MPKETELKEIEDVLPMMPNEGPPLPKVTGVTWKSLSSSSGLNLGSSPNSSLSHLNEITKVIPEIPEEIESITDVIFNALMAIRGTQGVLRSFKGLGSPEGLFGKQR